MTTLIVHSAQYRALQVLEIVELVFSFANRETAWQCAMVCRFWRELALNAYWSILDEYADFALLLLPYLLPENRCKCRLDCGPWIVGLLKCCTEELVLNDSAPTHTALS
jgi:hypothetical protein